MKPGKVDSRENVSFHTEVQLGSGTLGSQLTAESTAWQDCIRLRDRVVGVCVWQLSVRPRGG